MRVANNATAHLWLNQPSRVPGEGNHWFESLFSTHPPTAKRIERLDAIALQLRGGSPIGS